MVSKKIILTGSFGVGKTSLFTRFVYNRFSEKYLTTIGVKVDKKVLSTPEGDISLLIWDIAGEVSQDKVPLSYFLGASGLIYIFDLSRPATYENIETDLNHLKKIIKNCTIRVVGNKKDLVSAQQIEHIAQSMNIPMNIATSAKTGENVEQMFEDLAIALLTK